MDSAGCSTLMSPADSAQLAFSLRVAQEGPENVLVNAEGKREGSAAIAYGRGGVIAVLAGDKPLADYFWHKLIELSPRSEELSKTWPDFTQFAERARMQPANFTGFGRASGFNTDSYIANAGGSYAFALDALLRGKSAFVGGGEMEPTRIWGVSALQAAGFPGEAKVLDGLLLNRERGASAPGRAV